jgi:putative transposase
MCDLPIFCPLRGSEMTRKSYTEEWINSILKAHEARASAPDIALGNGVAESAAHRWKSECAGMEASEAKRLRKPDSENAKLKRLLGEAELDGAVLKELVEGK